MAKPKPVSRDIVCSECGLPWSDHEKVAVRNTVNAKTGKMTHHTEPTIETCVKLLKTALAARPTYQWSGTTSPATAQVWQNLGYKAQ